MWDEGEGEKQGTKSLYENVVNPIFHGRKISSLFANMLSCFIDDFRHFSMCFPMSMSKRQSFSLTHVCCVYVSLYGRIKFGHVYWDGIFHFLREICWLKFPILFEISTVFYYIVAIFHHVKNSDFSLFLSITSLWQNLRRINGSGCLQCCKTKQKSDGGEKML